MSGIIGTEWLNANSLRNYPLSQSATGVATNSSLEIPDNLFVDMKLAVPYIDGMHPANFYISSITVYPQGFVFEIGYSGSFSVPSVAVSSPVSFANFTSYSAVTLKGVSGTSGYDFSQISGVAILGEVSGLQSNVGTTTFELAAGRLESTVVSFGPRRISGVKVVNSGFTTPVISGQVVLNSGSNHSINYTAASNTLKFNAIDGGGLTATCGCNDVELNPCIRTINGQPADAQGNFLVYGGDCITVTNATNAISIADSCAKPCCGCNELQVVVGDVDLLDTQLSELAAQINSLASQVNSLQTACLSSSIDSASCSGG